MSSVGFRSVIRVQIRISPSATNLLQNSGLWRELPNLKKLFCLKAKKNPFKKSHLRSRPGTQTRF